MKTRVWACWWASDLPSSTIYANVSWLLLKLQSSTNATIPLSTHPSVFYYLTGHCWHLIAYSVFPFQSFFFEYVLLLSLVQWPNLTTGIIKVWFHFLLFLSQSSVYQTELWDNADRTNMRGCVLPFGRDADLPDQGQTLGSLLILLTWSYVYMSNMSLMYCAELYVSLYPIVSSHVKLSTVKEKRDEWW